LSQSANGALFDCSGFALRGFADIWHGSFAEAGNAMYKPIIPAWIVGVSQAAAGKIVIGIEE
jgi:hypothetical protein